MQRNQKIKLFLFCLVLSFTLIFALLFPRLTLPFGFSYIIYLMYKPLMTVMVVGSKRQRIMYSLLMSVGAFFLLFPVFATLYNSNTDFSSLSAQLPAIEKVLAAKFELFREYVFEKFNYRIKIEPVSLVMGKFELYGNQLLSSLPNYLSSVFEWLLLVPMFLYFFFKESHKVSVKLMEAIPNPIFEKTYVLFSQFNTKFAEYIIAKFIEATILGSLVTVGLLIVGFPYPFMLGFVAGVTNILPYIGPLIGFVPALFIALLSTDPKISTIAMFIVFLVANLIDMILVFPLLVSKIVNLHPIVVVVSVIVGSQLGGVIGMIVIIPFVAFFKLLFKEVYSDLSVHF